MFMPTPDRFVASAGLIDQKAFQVEMNSMLFHSVISGIYADKIRAPMRELATNARDGHAAAGNLDQPFDVTLPSQFVPEFRVRDYGCSLSHDDIMGLYSTMFASSKRDTNDAVGMIGLGSKSPFAYSNTFAVTAWMDGQKRTYACFIGDDDVPQIALLSTEDSDEPTGIEVSFAVKQEDINRFRDAAPMVFFGFEPRPNIKNETYQAVEPTVILSGDGWRVYETQAPITRLMARQGCVLYPIDRTLLGMSNSDLFSWRGVIDFPIGSLSVSTSRENLSYDTQTRKNLTDRLASFRDDLAKIIQSEVDDCKTYVEACKHVYENAHSHSLSSKDQIYRSVSSTLRWKGELLVTGFNIPASHHMYDKHTLGAGSVRQTVQFRNRNFTTNIPATRALDYVYAYEADDCTLGPSRLRQFIKDMPEAKPLIWFRDKAIYESLVDQFKSNDLIVDLRTIEPLTIRPKKNGTFKNLRYFEPIEQVDRWKGIPHATFESVELSSDMIYVLQDGQSFFADETRTRSVEGISNLIYQAYRTGVLQPDTRVYCINLTQRKYLDEVKMRPLHTVMRKNIIKMLKTANVTEVSHSYGEEHGRNRLLRSDKTPAEVLDACKKFNTALEEQRKNKVSTTLLDLFRLYCPDELAAAQQLANNPTHQLTTMYEKYPLLQLVSQRGSDDELNYYLETLK